MTEQEARLWIRERFGVSRETLVERLVAEVTAEAARQNLIAASTIDTLWSRHVVDSAQLLALPGDADARWLDIGTGAGFPGLVVACLTDSSVTLCEPRKRRVEFLERTISRLDVTNRVQVAPVKVERLTGSWPVISARAVAALDELFAAAVHVSDRETIWLLPKGRGAREEVEAARKTWHGSFHVEQSLTDPYSHIVIATGVRRRR